MPPPAYTRRLFGGNVTASSPGVAGPVPDGLEWVVTWLSAVAVTGGSGYLQLYVPGPLYLAVYGLDDFGDRPSVGLHQVVEPGETLTVAVTATDGTYNVVVTGYVLSLT